MIALMKINLDVSAVQVGYSLKKRTFTHPPTRLPLNMRYFIHDKLTMTNIEHCMLLLHQHPLHSIKFRCIRNKNIATVNINANSDEDIYFCNLIISFC